MAKDSTTKYNIDVAAALRSLNALTKGIEKYNASVDRSNKVQKKLKESSAQLRQAVVAEANSLQKLIQQNRRLASEERSRFEERKKFQGLSRDEFDNLQKLIQQNKRLAVEERGRVQIKQQLQSLAKTEQANLDKLIQQHRLLKQEEARRIKANDEKAELEKLIQQHKRLKAEEASRISVKRQIQGLNREEQSDLNRLIQKHKQLKAAEARRIGDVSPPTPIGSIRFGGTGRTIKSSGPAGNEQDIVDRINRKAVFDDLRAMTNAAGAAKLWGRAILQVEGESRKKNKTVQKQTEIVDQEATAQRNAAAGAQHLGRMWLTLRIAAGVLISRGITELINAIRQSTQDAAELSRRIAEVQTVSLELSGRFLKTAKSTGEWKTELQALSRAFGIPTLETTEALYQALSNQVVRAGNATNFMAQEMKLAITAASTLDEAVSVTSTVINAFHKDTSEAARINAVLFKAVDLGRFRLNELGSEFGRVSVLSNQLGISFEEQAGSIALLTRLGLNADVAQTLLTNVQLKLIKPTKTMTELFGQWGVTSGEAAVKTFGFSNVIRKLAEATEVGGDQMAELGEIFQDLRAITGAQGLVSNFSQLEDTISQVSNATEAFNTSFALSIEALGRRSSIEFEKLRQEFLNTFGEKLLRTFVFASEAFGGADNVLRSLLSTGVRAAEVYLAYQAAILAVSTAQSLMNINTGRSTIFLQTNTAAATANSVALIQLTAAQAAATLGITALIAGLSEFIIRAATAKQKIDNSLLSLRSELLERSREELEKTTNKIDTFSKSIERSNSTIFRTYLQFVASIRAVNTALSEDFAKKFKKIRETMADGLKVSTDVLEDRLKELTKRIDDVKKAIDDLKDRSIKVRAEAEEKGFEAGLVGKSDTEALRAIFERKRKLDADALAALRKGELDLADELFRRTERLAEDAERRIEAFKDKVKRDADEITARISTTGARTLEVESGASRVRSTVTPGRPRAASTTGAIGRAFGRVVGGVPRSGVTVERKIELEDTARLKLLEEALLTLRTDAAKVEREKVAAIEAGIRAKELERRKLEADAKTRGVNLEGFKKLVAEIDTFDAKQEGAAAKFATLLSATEAAGGKAGLKPEEQLQFLRQANATRILLEREARTKAAAEALDIESKALKESEKAADDARKRRIDAEKKAAEEIEAFANQNIEVAAKLRGEFVRGTAGC
jgi:TP901 family phage tail tape measure protein